jgi:hypothetical protein
MVIQAMFEIFDCCLMGKRVNMVAIPYFVPWMHNVITKLTDLFLDVCISNSRIHVRCYEK